jgi:hypothetical protein
MHLERIRTPQHLDLRGTEVLPYILMHCWQFRCLLTCHQFQENDIPVIDRSPSRELRVREQFMTAKLVVDPQQPLVIGLIRLYTV